MANESVSSRAQLSPVLGARHWYGLMASLTPSEVFIYCLMLTSEGDQDPSLLLQVLCGFESLKEGTVSCECFILPSARRKLVWENSQRGTSTASFYEGRIKELFFIICKAYISEYLSLIVLWNLPKNLKLGCPWFKKPHSLWVLHEQVTCHSCHHGNCGASQTVCS